MLMKKRNVEMGRFGMAGKAKSEKWKKGRRK
jgi:hypothetical protein